MDLKTLLAGRRARLGTLSGAGLLVLSGGLLLANLLSQKAFLRSDWSAGGRYSLSPASRRMLRELPDPVLLRAYLSAGLPSPASGNAQYVKDLLSEYRSAGKGRVRVEVVDPESSDKAKEDAQRAGVPPMRFTQVASDQFQVREGFLGVVMFYQDKQDVLPFVDQTENLEFELTSRLRKMSRTEKKSLGLVTGHGEPPLDHLRQGPAAKLFDLFDVRAFDLASATGPAVDVLFVVNPAGEFKPSDLDALDVLVSSGVPTAFFFGRKSVSFQNFGVYPRPTGLDGFLAHYGLRLGDDIVLDSQCQQVTLRSSRGGMTVTNILSYPAFILSRADGGHPVTRSLESLSFPFAHPVIPTGSTGVVVTPLAASSSRSWLPPNLLSMDPYSLRPAAPEDPRGPFTLAAAAEGSLPSFRDAGRTARVKLALVGSGYFLDGQLPLLPGNADFPSFLAEWMTQGDDFLSIPSRGSSFRPLRPAPPVVRVLVKALSYFFLPFAVVLWGLARWRRRRADRPSIQKEWEASSRA